jgi:hypothetical protein
MIDPAELEQRYEALDKALESWRQGDFVIGPLGFIVRSEPEIPLSAEDRDEVPDADLYEQDVEGLVILTQTCDVVRKSKDRPFLEVGPLVRVNDEAHMRIIMRGSSPRYAYLPGAASRMLVADLDRVMTVEKGVLATWTRETGCRSDQEQRAFAEALARKRARFAFPDDFASLVERLRARITQKHSKESPEGACLRSLREIRVAAFPQWDAPSVSLLFWFIVADGVSPVAEDLRQQCKTWMDNIGPIGRYSSVDYDIVTLDGISAREYLNSDRLDLDHLSKTQ